MAVRAMTIPLTSTPSGPGTSAREVTLHETASGAEEVLMLDVPREASARASGGLYRDSRLIGRDVRGRRGCAGGAANDQAGRAGHLQVGRVVVEQIDAEPSGGQALGSDVLSDGGEVGQGGHRVIVDPDDGDVAARLQADLAQALHGADRHLVGEG